MALPVPSKSYVYNVNNAVTSGAAVLDTYRLLIWNLKNALVNGGWTIRSSANGTSASTSPPDLWPNAGSLVWGSSSRSWIVLRHPLGTCEICIDLQSANAYFWTLAISRQGYVTTGLSTNSRPATVASDEQLLASATNSAWGNTNQNFVWHYIKSTDDEVHRWFACAADTNPMSLFIDVPQNPVAGWNGALAQLPFVAYFAATGSNTNALTTATYSVANSVTRMGDGSGTPVPQATPIATNLYLAGESYNGNLLTNGLTIPNDVTEEYPLVAPQYVCTGTPGLRGVVGDPPDLWFGVSSNALSTAYPAGTSYQFVQLGTLVIPWNGTMPITA